MINPKNKTTLKEIQKNTKTSNTSSVISILNMRDSKEPIVFLRNIFDYFELDEYIDYCKVSVLHDGSKHVMKKVYNKK